MPKYILLGLVVVIATFMIMNYWPKLKDTTKNKIIASIFGVIAIGFVFLIQGFLYQLLIHSYYFPITINYRKL